jgi:hypothetical protein
VAAGLVAGLRALAAARPQPSRRPGNPKAGHRATLAEKQAAHELYLRVRDERMGQLPAAVQAMARLPRPHGHVTERCGW